MHTIPAAAARSADPAQAKFEFDGATYSLASMLEANEDDADLCDWLRNAAVGDVFPAIAGACTRVS